MNLQRQTSNHYYGWSGIPNQWINDNDRSYHDKFFDDKNYEDFYFDNFYDMDEMFGHKNSLFGTRGLPVGHPNRSSKSFDTYNKKFGPMIVRVIKNNDLHENIRKVLKEETNYTRMLLRRLPTDILNNIDNLFNSSLNYISKIFIKSYNSDPNKLSEREFIRRVIEDFLSITGARHYLPDQESDEYTQWSKTLTNELTNKYKDKIKSRGDIFVY